MIDYYRINKVKNNSSGQNQRLKLTDDSQIKDCIYNKKIYNIKVLSFKNTNIKDDSFLLFKTIPSSVILPTIELDLSCNFTFITDRSIQIICELNLFPQLKILNLADNLITDESLALISKTFSFSKLQQLTLYGNSDITSEGLIVLASSPYIKHLKRLDLHDTSVCDQGLAYFFKLEICSQLQDLNLSMNFKRITNKSLFAYNLSKYCNKLKTLNLEDCNITDVGVEELAQTQNSSSLRQLNLNNSIKIKDKNNQITDKALSSIAFSRHMTNLKILQLRNTDISPKGIKTLSVSLASENIQILRMSHCKNLNDEVFTYLQKIISYDSLRKVYLNDCVISGEQMSAFELKNQQINFVF